MPRASTAGDWIALLALTLLWGTTFALNEVAIMSLTPSQTVCGRLLIASGVLYLFMRANGLALPRTPAAWKPMLVLAVFGSFLPFLLVAWAQQYIDSSTAGVLMAMMPLFVLTLAHFFVPGSRLTAYRIIGFVVGFSGVVLVIGPKALAGLDHIMALLGSIAVLGAALSYSINSIYARQLDPMNPIQMSAGMLLVAGMLSFPAAAVDVAAIARPAGTSVLALLVLGLFSTGLATVLYFRVIQGPGPTFLSLVNYLVPAWAVFAGAFFLDETLSLTVYAGLALILAGIAMSEVAPRLLNRRRTRKAGDAGPAPVCPGSEKQ